MTIEGKQTTIVENYIKDNADRIAHLQIEVMEGHRFPSWMTWIIVLCGLVAVASLMATILGYLNGSISLLIALVLSVVSSVLGCVAVAFKRESTQALALHAALHDNERFLYRLLAAQLISDEDLSNQALKELASGSSASSVSKL